MNEKQVERVARAIFEARIGRFSNVKANWNPLEDRVKDNFRTEAKADIKAAFEPLPIEEAPINTPLLIVRHDGIFFHHAFTENDTAEFSKQMKDFYGKSAVGYIPLPTQEGEE